MALTALILTFNEARHIERAIRSVAPVADRILVVDSGSTDDTVARARTLGAEVLTHAFVTQAKQFNWALDQLPPDTGWVLRLDADEIVSGALASEIATRLPHVPAHVAGLTLPRHIVFLGRRIRYGGVSPTPVLRLFRYGRGRSEDRWMDEHIAVDGAVEALAGALTDDNRNPLGWWIDKHNRYASREALQILLTESAGKAPAAPRAPAGPDRTPRGTSNPQVAPLEVPQSTTQTTAQNKAQSTARAATDPSRIGHRATTTRWLKDHLYARAPASLRALAYFLYRYLLRGGFRDGYPGLAFHVLQGFWYRFLVDAKLHEARAHMAATGADLPRTAREILGLDTGPDPLGEDQALPPSLHLGPNTSRPAATHPRAAARQEPSTPLSETAQTKEPPHAAPHLSLLR